MTDYYTKKGVDQALALKANSSDLAALQGSVTQNTSDIAALKAAGSTPAAALIPVTPTAPTITDVDGVTHDTITIPACAGVDYYLNGTITGAGTYPAPASSAATVTTKPQTGYGLTGTTSWQFSWTSSVVRQITGMTGVSSGRFSVKAKYNAEVYSSTNSYTVKARETANGIVVRFGNVDVKYNAMPSAPILAASIKVDGVKHQFMFAGSARTTIPGGTIVQSDPLDVTLQKGQSYSIYVYYQVAQGSTDGWPIDSWGVVDSSTAQVTWIGSYANPGADVTTPGSPEGAPAQTAISPPLSITGRVATPTTQAVAIFGDSIAAATGETQDAINLTTGAQAGFIVRWLQRDGSFAWSNYAIGGTLFDNFNVDGAIDRLCGNVGSMYTHTIVEWGINQLTAGGDIKTAAIKSWGILASRGFPKLIQMTCTPYTTSTDSFATTTNQTKFTGARQSERDAWNAWLRDGAPMSDATTPAAVGATGVMRAGDTGHPLFKVVDSAAGAESATGSGIWQAKWTDEGLHPNGTGHAGIAAAMPAPGTVLV